MLEKLRIRNFQKHRKLDFEFKPGVSTAVGPTDSGKSAVYRAIKLVCLNKPSGIAFITNGEDSSKVTLYFDGRKVARARGISSKINSYGLDSATYSAMGSEVPDKVREALGISQLNFQSQFDTAYWFNEGDAKVAKELNAIINLSEIDDTFTRLNLEHRRAKAEYDVRLANVDALRARKKACAGAVQLDEDVTTLEVMDTDIHAREKQCAILSVLIEEAESAKTAQTELRAIVKDIEGVVVAGDAYADAWRDAKKLSNLIDEAECLKHQLVAVPDTTALTAAHDAWVEAANQESRLSDLLDSLRADYKSRRTAETEWKAALADVAAAKPSVCPTCGQPVKSKHHHG